MSIYIHIPFCNFICNYCDFCKLLYNEKYVNNYLDILGKEIDDRYNNERVKTIYIGGGTPSSLSYSQLERLLIMTKKFNSYNNVEFTVECNIESLDEDKLKLMKEYGVNRLSIGVQSFDDNIINILGRKHNKEMIIGKISTIKNYFDNINIDLIYAVTDDINVVKNDIDIFLSLDIPHVSFYSLVIEDNTILKINGYKNISEDIDYEMYNYIENKLESNGYFHYEISNYAKKGYESKHNLAYWNNEYYYGFGLGSTSYIDNNRIINTKNLSKYLNGIYCNICEYEDIDVRLDNELMLGFRKMEGINLSCFEKKYGISFFDIFDVNKLLKENYLELIDNYIRVNKKYMYVLDSILLKIDKK